MVSDYLKEQLHENTKVYEIGGTLFLFYRKGENPFNSHLSVSKVLSMVVTETGEKPVMLAYDDEKTIDYYLAHFSKAGYQSRVLL